MVILDVAIVNVALPSIKSDLGFSATGIQWVITAYAILFGGTLLLGGRLADLLGRRRMFVAGLALFGASSLLSGFAWSAASLVASCIGASYAFRKVLRRARKGQTGSSDPCGNFGASALV